MLEIIIPECEDYDPKKNEFINYKKTVLHLEHSLLSISKWESKWKKPFLGKQSKTFEEVIDYIRCMTVGSLPAYGVYYHLTSEDYERINAYIEDSMTATTFSDHKSGSSREIVTSELIYYWMITLGIPFECQKWHLNKLLTLIRVCSIKNAPAKRMSRREILSRNAALNSARRKALNTSG